MTKQLNNNVKATTGSGEASLFGDNDIKVLKQSLAYVRGMQMDLGNNANILNRTSKVILNLIEFRRNTRLVEFIQNQRAQNPFLDLEKLSRAYLIRSLVSNQKTPDYNVIADITNQLNIFITLNQPTVRDKYLLGDTAVPILKNTKANFNYEEITTHVAQMAKILENSQTFFDTFKKHFPEKLAQLGIQEAYELVGIMTPEMEDRFHALIDSVASEDSGEKVSAFNPQIKTAEISQYLKSHEIQTILLEGSADSGVDGLKKIAARKESSDFQKISSDLNSEEKIFEELNPRTRAFLMLVLSDVKKKQQVINPTSILNYLRAVQGTMDNTLKKFLEKIQKAEKLMKLDAQTVAAVMEQLKLKQNSSEAQFALVDLIYEWDDLKELLLRINKDLLPNVKLPDTIKQKLDVKKLLNSWENILNGNLKDVAQLILQNPNLRVALQEFSNSLRGNDMSRVQEKINKVMSMGFGSQSQNGRNRNSQQAKITPVLSNKETDELLVAYINAMAEGKIAEAEAISKRLTAK